MLTIGHYPAVFLIIIYLPEIDSHPVTLMPFWPLLENLSRQPLLICTRRPAQDNPVEMHAELASSMLEKGKF